ncbi:hypothetical protein ACFL0V_06980 [Nanoarchaeota archaeon]
MKKILFLIIISISLLLAGCGSSISSPDDDQVASKQVIKTPTKTTTKTTTPTKTTTTKTTPTVKVAPPAEPTYDELEAKAKEIAIEYVKNLGGYKDQAGRKIKAFNAFRQGGEDDWLVDIRFERSDQYYPEKTEIITVNVDIEDWEVDSYRFN